MKLLLYREGNIAAALYKAGGTAYESECTSKLCRLSVSGRYFGCKSVYHLPFLSSDQTLGVSIDGLIG